MGLFSKNRKILVERVLSTELMLSDWTASEELVASAQKLRRDPSFRTMMDVLRNESPARFGLGLPGTGVTSDDRIAHACRIEGYNLALNNIEAMMRLDRKSAPLEATFEAEEVFSPAVTGKVT